MISFGLNKKKLRFQVVLYMVLGVIVFLAFFGWADSQESIPPVLLQASGMIIALFLVIAAGAKGKKLNSASAGLIIDKDGVTDETSEIGLGKVKWADIVEVKHEESKRVGLLLIAVKKQEKFLRNAKNNAIQRLLKQNIKLYDTPVAIDTSYLDASMDDILDSIEQLKR